jgi:hypothetical protein
MPVETRYEHIRMNEAGVPVIMGTTMKVVELGSRVPRLRLEPRRDSLPAPVPQHGAGPFGSRLYWDHKSELDGDIERRLEAVDAIQQSTPISPFVQRLRAAISA